MALLYIADVVEKRKTGKKKRRWRSESEMKN